MKDKQKEAFDFLEWSQKNCDEKLKELAKNIAIYGRVRKINGIVFLTK